MNMSRVWVIIIGAPILIIAIIVGVSRYQLGKVFAKAPADGTYAAGLALDGPIQGHHVILDRVVIAKGLVRFDFSFPNVDGKPVIGCPSDTSPNNGFGQTMVVDVPAPGFSGADDRRLLPQDYECNGHAGRRLTASAGPGRTRFWASFANSKQFGHTFEVNHIISQAPEFSSYIDGVQVDLSRLQRR
jgi:hypothetical protein